MLCNLRKKNNNNEDMIFEEMCSPRIGEIGNTEKNELHLMTPNSPVPNTRYAVVISVKKLKIDLLSIHNHNDPFNVNSPWLVIPNSER